MSVSTHRIKAGLDLPIQGSVRQEVRPVKKEPKFLALKGRDFIGMKPSLLVKEGDEVKIGQPLFRNKKINEIVYVSPGGGKVVAINRGERREFLSLVIELDSKEDELTFKSYGLNDLAALSKEEIVGQLLNSGQWPLIRRRPFESVANPSEKPHSIFVTAVDSNPYAMDKSILFNGNEESINAGLTVLSRLTDGDVHFCLEEGKSAGFIKSDRVKVHSFSGKHPYGNVGTHIHFIDPVGPKKCVWHLSVSSLIAIGDLFLTGKIKTERVVSLGGTVVKEGHLVKTRLGAELKSIVFGELSQEENVRLISGSVLAGSNASPSELSYLGYYHDQVSVIKEQTQRQFLGMNNPGFNLFSVKNIFLSKLTPGKKFDMTTEEFGGKRAIFPMTSYQDVMPLDIEAIFLLKSLAAKDIESSIELGALELAEEDLALCSFVCPGKNDHGAHLREMLNLLEKEE